MIFVLKASGNRLFVVRINRGEGSRRGDLEWRVVASLVKGRDLLVSNTVTSKILLHFMP